MESWAEKLSQQGSELFVQLKSTDRLDPGVFRQMENDENTLGCLLVDAAKGQLMYSTESFIPLPLFMKQYQFEKEEGYLFFADLFQKAIDSNRNKPVLFEPELTYVSPDGTVIKFAVLPLRLDQWLFDQDKLKEWVEFICRTFQTSTAFEFTGFLLQFCHSPEMSFQGLLEGLRQMRLQYYPPKWYKRKVTKFVARQPVIAWPVPAEPQLEPVLGLPAVPVVKEPEKPEVPAETETAIIGQLARCSAWLDDQGERYDLLFEEMLVGRGMQCQIRLADASVSIKHARITCDQQRYYIQDLKSSNHTYLNDKQVVRKMRLKEGMSVKFGAKELVFHQLA